MSLPTTQKDKINTNLILSYQKRSSKKLDNLFDINYNTFYNYIDWIESSLTVAVSYTFFNISLFLYNSP